MTAARRIAVIGGGPAGLMAAECAAAAGASVVVFEAMPGCGRKLLIAGRGGLNLTHGEDSECFVARYRERAEWMAGLLADFDAAALREWAAGLGVETFVGSSGRVFPRDFKAATLLARWLARLRGLGVAIHTRHRFHGFADAGLKIRGPDDVEPRVVAADAVVLALGGASWPETGSDGGWVEALGAAGVELAAWRPANCGFDVDWSPAMARFAGTPLKNLELRCGEAVSRGECVITATGIEGQAVYALGPELRSAIEREGSAVLLLDLARQRSVADLAERLAAPRGKRSLSEHLRRRANLRGPAYSLLREALPAQTWEDPVALAAGIKALPLRLARPRPLAEAISSAGGVRIEACTPDLELRALPRVFVCGEMLDWEAPTGGYLLQGCFATGARAGAAAGRRAV